MMIKVARRLALAMLMTTSVLSVNTLAQTYPSKPIRLICPFPPPVAQWTLPHGPLHRS